MDYIVVGVNHKTAPVELREKLTFGQENIPQALARLTGGGCAEGLILSTCNRVEIYAAVSEKEEGLCSLKRFMTEHGHLDLSLVEPHLYGYASLEAVHHGFRVAASLDSMVLGENQILSQVKKAYQTALDSRSTGTFLNRFVNRALYVAKLVRTETEIGSRAVSVGSAGVELAAKIFEDLSSKCVALIGTGKIGSLVLESLKLKGVKKVILVNRSLEKARELAQDDDEVTGLDRLEDVLLQADVVITSIAGDRPLLTKDYLAGLMKKRRHHALFFIDLGLPRNIEPTVNDLGNVYLYNIDDLEKVVEGNRAGRQIAASDAEVLVEKEASRFYQTVLDGGLAIDSLGKKFDEIRRKELSRSLRKLGHLSADDCAAIDKLTAAIVTRILHDPIMTLKSGATHDRDWKAAELLRRLFNLEEE